MAMFRNRKRRTEVLERPEYGWIWKPLLTLLVLYLVVCIGLGIWWSQRPDGFDIDQAVVEWRGASAEAPVARGAAFASTLVTTIDTLLDKPGGLLRNDVAPPGVWLDNMPSWEYGVLSQARLATSALASMGSGESALLANAEEALDSDSRSWLYPSAEERYASAVDALHNYVNLLGSDDSATLADNGEALASWLRAVGDRLAELTRRLSASVDDPEALRELGVDEAELPEATSWYRIDNVFFEARGEAWALMHYLRAAKRDFDDVFEKAGTTAGLERMIAELEMAQRPLWSPVVLNGSGFGIFANHSLVLANYIMEVRDQARQLAASVEGVEVSAPRSAPQAAPEPADQQAPAQPTPAGGNDGAATRGAASQGAPQSSPQEPQS